MIFRFTLPWAPLALDFWLVVAALALALTLIMRPWRYGRVRGAAFGVLALWLFGGAVVIARAADAGATTVSASPWVAIVAPLAQSIAYAVVTALVAFLAALVQRYVGVRIDQATQAKLDGYIENLAGAEIAKASDNLSHAQIDVKSPIVKAIVDRVAADLPAEMQALGVTPEAVAAKVAGAFGKLQAQMTVIAPVAAPAK